jgi:hypothetical protein
VHASLSQVQLWAKYGGPRSDWRNRAARQQDGAFDKTASGVAGHLAEAAIAHESLVEAAETCDHLKAQITNARGTRRRDAIDVAITRAKEQLEKVRTGVLPRIRSLAASEAPDIQSREKADLRASTAELEHAGTEVERGLNDFAARPPGFRLADGRRLDIDGKIM